MSCQVCEIVLEIRALGHTLRGFYYRDEMNCGSLGHQDTPDVAIDSMGVWPDRGLESLQAMKAELLVEIEKVKQILQEAGVEL